MNAAAENNIPQIIQEAAKSNRGIFALMIIALALIGFYFFNRSRLQFRVGVFVTLFSGVAVFGWAVFDQKTPLTPVHQQPDPSPSQKSPVSVIGQQVRLIIKDLVFTNDLQPTNLVVRLVVNVNGRKSSYPVQRAWAPASEIKDAVIPIQFPADSYLISVEIQNEDNLHYLFQPSNNSPIEFRFGTNGSDLHYGQFTLLRYDNDIRGERDGVEHHDSRDTWGQIQFTIRVD